MNKNYIYIDGKVIISDKNGNNKQQEYYDNLDEVLIKENVIEEIENRIKELNRKKDSFKNKKFMPTSLFYFISAIPISPFLLWMISGANPFITDVSSIFGTISSAALCTITTATGFIPFGLLITKIEYNDYKRKIKDEQATDCELEFLKSQLVEKKELLNKLKNDKSRDKEDKTFRSKFVEDTKELKELHTLSRTYYDLSYNSEKYYKYYKKGKLEEKLHNYYNDFEIELAKDYLEEKGPTLIKKL